MESQDGPTEQSVRGLSVGREDFVFRADAGNGEVHFWRDLGSHDQPFVAIATLTRAAAAIRKATGAKKLSFGSAPAPEHFDQSSSEERVPTFNTRLVRALKAVGVPAQQAEGLFNYVGMPSEWRGAMQQGAELAEAVPARTEAQRRFAQRISTVCRFMPIAMENNNGLFKWILAVGSQALENGTQRFEEQRHHAARSEKT